jgi:cytochrome c oxidase cbb3-type subunit I/II
MPPYPFLFDTKADFKTLPKRIATMTFLGVPYPKMSKDAIEQSARDQAMEISAALVKAGAFIPDQKDLSEAELMRHLAETKVVALIAYMQKVGVYDKVDHTRESKTLDPDTIRAAAKAPIPPTTSSN